MIVTRRQIRSQLKMPTPRLHPTNLRKVRRLLMRKIHLKTMMRRNMCRKLRNRPIMTAGLQRTNKMSQFNNRLRTLVPLIPQEVQSKLPRFSLAAMASDSVRRKRSCQLTSRLMLLEEPRVAPGAALPSRRRLLKSRSKSKPRALPKPRNSLQRT